MDAFHNDIESIKSNLIENAYPPFLIDKVIKKSLLLKWETEVTRSNEKWREVTSNSRSNYLEVVTEVTEVATRRNN